jgi:hypothetical protein
MVDQDCDMEMIWVVLATVAVAVVLVRLARQRRRTDTPESGSTVGVWDSRRQNKKAKEALRAATDMLRSRGRRR